MIEIVKKYSAVTSCELIKSVESAVTTAWGVRWNEMQIARDVMQNFYDANRDDLQAVTIKAHDRDVVIAAPAPFDVERLFYLGSEKHGDDIGQYGEGFKAAATCLLRDHGVQPIALSGSTLVHIHLAAANIPGSNFRALIYDFYRVEPAYLGAALILSSCSPLLANEILHGMAHFFSDHNPLLGSLIWESYDKGYALYRSAGSGGHIFYKKLKRAAIDGIPVVLAIHKFQARIDKKIDKDRDRNAFEESVLDLCYGAFARQAASSDKVVHTILAASIHCWERGHMLLSAVAKHRDRAGKEADALFANRYFAKSLERDAATQLRIANIEREWKAEGRRELPAYFTSFGVPSGTTYLKQLEDRALKEQKKQERSLTTKEHHSLGVLLRVLEELAPALSGLFKTKQVRYTAADTETILGALLQDRPYRSVNIYLSAQVFTDDFPTALAVFLHEHVHIFGWDGDRGFSDALTELIEGVVRFRSGMDDHEKRWNLARNAVIAERGVIHDSLDDSVIAQLSALDRVTLLELLARIPVPMLRPLLKKRGEADENE